MASSSSSVSLSLTTSTGTAAVSTTETHQIIIQDDEQPPNKKKKKQRWSRAEKRAAALQEEKTLKPSLTERLIQCAERCPLGAVLLRQSSQNNDILRVVTSTNNIRSDDDDDDDDDDTDCHIHVKPLLILDLNGILCHRIRTKKEPDNVVYRSFDAHVAGTPVVARPHLHAFLEQQQHVVCLALWTSAKRKTVHALLEQLQIPVSRFLFVWGQDQCLSSTTTTTASADPYNCLFQKDLQKVWDKYPLWNIHNTVLLDDSMEKIIASQCQAAMHPVPLNGQLLSLHDDAVCFEQDAFMQHFVQHWQQHALKQDYSIDASLATVTTTRWQWEFLQQYSRPNMMWGGGLGQHSNTRENENNHGSE